jgi:hypothetical protein
MAQRTSYDGHNIVDLYNTPCAICGPVLQDNKEDFENGMRVNLRCAHEEHADRFRQAFTFPLDCPHCVSAYQWAHVLHSEVRANVNEMLFLYSLPLFGLLLHIFLDLFHCKSCGINSIEGRIALIGLVVCLMRSANNLLYLYRNYMPFPYLECVPRYWIVVCCWLCVVLYACIFYTAWFG